MTTTNGTVVTVGTETVGQSFGTIGTLRDETGTLVGETGVFPLGHDRAASNAAHELAAKRGWTVRGPKPARVTSYVVVVGGEDDRHSTARTAIRAYERARLAGLPCSLYVEPLGLAWTDNGHGHGPVDAPAREHMAEVED